MRLLSVTALIAGTVLTPVGTAVAAPSMPDVHRATPAIAAPAQRAPVAGSRGPGVVRLQQALLAAGVPVAGGTDGVFGAGTYAAVRRYQAAAGLPVSGVVDPRTASWLRLYLPQRGEHGDRVTTLQRLLVASGIRLDGGADGIYGPATAAAVESFQRAVGLRPTGVVDDATAVKLNLRPVPARVAAARVAGTRYAPRLAAFPVQGICGYRDGWLAPRAGGRRHLGVDIIAPKGKYVYAVVDGIITQRVWDLPGRISGNALVLTAIDGTNTYYYYGHLQGFAVARGARVKAGQIIGVVGSTGLSSTAHLHFEVHPGGGPAVNPYPLVRAIDRCSETRPGPNAFG